ncbi:MAG TPA: hypothetical protein VK986_00975 [Tepidisphaeraceae bacterium]|nr:hypothetical protein [Tepidisphaeraceae bacterium]
MRIATLIVLSIVLGASQSRAEKPRPPVGPKAVEGVKEVRPQDEAADAAHRAHSARVDAQTTADLARAAFERKRRPGPLADDERGTFDAIVLAYRKAIDLDPVGEIGGYCRLRLAGAHQYVGDFDGAGRILTEAVNVARGPEARVKALYEMALFELQARKRPAQALEWATRARAALERTPDDPANQVEADHLAAIRAKWETGIGQVMERAGAELRLEK